MGIIRFYFKKFQKYYIHFCLKSCGNYNVYRNNKPLNFWVEFVTKSKKILKNGTGL